MLQREQLGQVNNKNAFWLGTVVGLLGIFGIGHFYLGRTQRGIAFLCGTCCLAIVVVAGLFVPLLWQTVASPAVIFGIIWLVQTYDLYTLTLKKSAFSK